MFGWLVLFGFAMSACTLIGEGETAVSPSPPQSTPTHTPTPVETIEAAISTAVTATAVISTQNTLTLWIPQEIFGSSEAGLAALNAQLDVYRASHPDLELRVESKTTTGQGSIVNYLRTGHKIADTILPDLVALPTNQLASTTADGLIVPLEDYVDATLLEDVYPAGLELVRQGNSTLGYPFVLSQPPHLAYDSTLFTNTMPITWTEFIELPGQSFVFPAGGTPGETLLLELYLAAGGTLTNESGQVELQVEPLVIALQQISNGRSNGFILPQSSEIQTLEDSWLAFQNSPATFVQTTGVQFLRQRSDERPLGAAAIPGLENVLPPLVSGWAWAISSPDALKRPLAADLLTFLVENENLGEWSFQSQQLPARQGAFFFWPEDDPYVPFISTQLLAADAHPFLTDDPVMVALGDALFAVITATKTPQVAAQEAITSLQQ